MTSKTLSIKYWLLVSALVLVVPLTILFFYQKQSIKRLANTDVPKIAEQPKDTMVAEGIVPLHFWKTKNNIPVYFVPTENLPIVDIDVSFDAGSARDTAEKAGLAYLTMKMLKEGTAKLPNDPDAIAAGFENVGAKYDANISRDRVSFQLRLLSQIKQFADTINLFSEVISQPNFSSDSWDRVKDATKVQLLKAEQDPAYVASRTFFKEAYQEHPYAHPMLGSIDTLARIQSDDIKAFHQQFYVAKNAYITIVGGIHRNRAKDLAEKIAMNLKTGKTPATINKVMDLNGDPSVQEVKFPSQQSHIIIGQPGEAQGDEKLYPLLVGNYILGGRGMTSRLYKEVREAKGLAYSVYSQFLPFKEKGPFVVSLQTQGTQTKQALDIARDVLKDFVSGGPSEEEILSAKQHLLGAFPLQFDSNAKLLQHVSEQAFYGLGHDFFEKYSAAIEQVTKEDILNAFKEHLDPDKMVLVVVGDKQ